MRFQPVLSSLLLTVLIFPALAPAIDSQDSAALGFLWRYRYAADTTAPGEDFHEIRWVARHLTLLYTRLHTLGRDPFVKDIWQALESLSTDTPLLCRFLLFSDRLVRARAFDINLYNVDIRSGKARDSTFRGDRPCEH